MPILCVPMFNFAPLGEEEKEKDEDEDEDEEGGKDSDIGNSPADSPRKRFFFFFFLLSSPNHLARGTHGRERRCVVSGGFFNYKSAEPA